MMRKTSLILLGAAAGAALTLFAAQPRMFVVGTSVAKAATSDPYRQLNLFGDVFERVRADYVEKPDDGKLIETAINGMLAGLDPHSSYMDAKAARTLWVGIAWVSLTVGVFVVLWGLSLPHFREIALLGIPFLGIGALTLRVARRARRAGETAPSSSPA